MTQRPLVYFWCVGNAMRSQMAEGFLRHHAGDRYAVRSAGTHPLGLVLPDVVTVMAEKGIDVSGYSSDPIEPDIVEAADVVIDLGGQGSDRLPGALAHKYVHWCILDPYGMPVKDLRATRDEIERRVLAWLAERDGEALPPQT